jgi:hypothetical protein
MTHDPDAVIIHLVAALHAQGSGLPPSADHIYAAAYLLQKSVGLPLGYTFRHGSDGVHSVDLACHISRLVKARALACDTTAGGEAQLRSRGLIDTPLPSRWRNAIDCVAVAVGAQETPTLRWMISTLYHLRRWADAPTH